MEKPDWIEGVVLTSVKELEHLETAPRFGLQVLLMP